MSLDFVQEQCLWMLMGGKAFSFKPMIAVGKGTFPKWLESSRTLALFHSEVVHTGQTCYTWFS